MSLNGASARPASSRELYTREMKGVSFGKSPLGRSPLGKRVLPGDGSNSTLRCSLSSIPPFDMNLLLRRCLPAIWCLLAVFSAVAVLPAPVLPVAAQDRDGLFKGPGALEKIDGTPLGPAILSYDAMVEMGGQSQDLSSTQTFAPPPAGPIPCCPAWPNAGHWKWWLRDRIVSPVEASPSTPQTSAAHAGWSY